MLLKGSKISLQQFILIVKCTRAKVHGLQKIYWVEISSEGAFIFASFGVVDIALLLTKIEEISM